MNMNTFQMFMSLFLAVFLMAIIVDLAEGKRGGGGGGRPWWLKGNGPNGRLTRGAGDDPGFYESR